jgi:hypothetical protein
MPPSGPVSATSLTVGTARRTSTNVSVDTALVTGSQSSTDQHRRQLAGVVEPLNPLPSSLPA